MQNKNVQNSVEVPALLERLQLTNEHVTLSLSLKSITTALDCITTLQNIFEEDEYTPLFLVNKVYKPYAIAFITAFSNLNGSDFEAYEDNLHNAYTDMFEAYEAVQVSIEPYYKRSITADIFLRIDDIVYTIKEVFGYYTDALTKEEEVLIQNGIIQARS